MLTDLQSAVESGDRKEANRLTQEALDAGVSERELLAAMTSAMDVVGRKFQAGEMFVPEMLIAARALKEGMKLLEPRLVAAGIRPEFTAVIGTIEGYMHDIGKNLVAIVWRGANFNVVDLGVNVPPTTFLAAAREHDADLIGVSALLTTTMASMAATVQTLRDAGLADVPVMVGGAPVMAEFADTIGADGYAPDAVSAVEIGLRLVGAAG